MRRFGVPELVPQQTQQPSDMSGIGSLDVDRLGLATTTGINGSSAFNSVLDSGSAGRQLDLEITSPSTSTNKRPLEMEIDDSEDDKRQRT